MAFPLESEAGLPRPKNIIILIGDGMGYNQIKALDFYLGMNAQVFEQFPVQLAMATYPVKAGEYKDGLPGSNYFATGYNTVAAWKDTAFLRKNFTESAAAATAMATGFKTYNNAIGMSVVYDTLKNLIECAKALGKSAGVVSTVPFSHATPAGFTVHNKVRTNYGQIACQMLFDSRCDVMMGCGNPMFDDDGKKLQGKWKDSKYVGDSVLWQQLIRGSGERTRFLIHGKIRTAGDCNGDGKPDPWTLITKMDDFQNLEKGKTPKRVLGCPEVYSTLQQARTFSKGETKDSPPYTTPFVSSVPSLALMVTGALNVLDSNPNGFFCMIEGGAIDWAAHSNQKGRLIEELTGFGEAVKAVVHWVGTHSNWNETMVIVTGDHETGYLWGGAPFVPVKNNGQGQLPGMQFNSDNHTNSLLSFFAKGPGSDLYKGFADEYDSIRGPFIQNSEISQLIQLLWKK
ncbi:MAG: alkaline phosphatase [Bacteroidota bacterium]